MNDQAEALRVRISQLRQPRKSALPKHEVHVIAVASGKGGVGKSNFCINFALALMDKGLRPIVIDTDVGFSNIEVLLGVRPTHTLLDVLGTRDIWSVIQYSSDGLPFLSAGSGLTDIHRLVPSELDILVDELSKLGERFDVILLDAGAGLGAQMERFIRCAEEMILITTPEPTALSDAYALMKMLSSRGALPMTRVVVNRVPKLEDGRVTADKLQGVVQRFLNVDLDVLGYIVHDQSIVHAVMQQSALYTMFPKSAAAVCFAQLSQRYVKLKTAKSSSGLSNFVERFFRQNSDSGGDLHSISSR